MTEEEIKILERFIELKIWEVNERDINPTSDYIFENLLAARRDLRNIQTKNT